MQKLKTSLRRIVYYTKKDLLTVSNIILVGALFLCASWAVGSITTMTKNWQLQKKLQQKHIDYERLKLEVELLQLEKKYYASDEYLEIMARKKGEKMADGETMLIMAENSDYAKNKYNVVAESENPHKDNFSEWMKFLFK